jgi:hypothetical protein
MTTFVVLILLAGLLIGCGLGLFGIVAWLYFLLEHESEV